MKPRNQFAHLPEQDRKHILDLCSKHTYDEVVDIVYQTREEGGLDLITSASALCRFYTTSHPEPSRAVLAQYAAATHVRHQQENNAFLGAIRAGIECRVLESLKNGKALADLDKDVRLLKTVQDLYFKDADFRRDRPKAARAAYVAHVQRCAEAPESDFIRDDLLQAGGDPGAPDCIVSDFHGDYSEFEWDVVMARLQREMDRKKHDEECSARRAAQNQTTNQPNQSVPPPTPEKGPVIPPIPLNSTSADAAQNPNKTAPPASSPAQKPTTDHTSKSLGNQVIDTTEFTKTPVIPHIPLNSIFRNDPSQAAPLAA